MTRSRSPGGRLAVLGWASRGRPGILSDSRTPLRSLEWCCGCTQGPRGKPRGRGGCSGAPLSRAPPARIPLTFTPSPPGRPELVQTLPGRAPTETRFVPAALQLAGALDLPAGSCAFEENTCGFDSVLQFQPWFLNEEGKGASEPPRPRGELSSLLVGSFSRAMLSWS